MKRINYQFYSPKFKEVRFKDEDWAYIAPSWEAMHQVFLDLGVKILQSGLHFEVLVTLIKGGWTWARTMADILAIPELTSFRVRFYDPKYPGLRLKKPVLETKLYYDLKNKNVLLFDDVDDSGATLIFAIKYLKKFKPKLIKTATLFHKPHSEITPDFYGAVSSAWIIFPYELRETISGLAKKWESKGLKKSKIKDRLLKIGLPKKEIGLFLSL